MTHSLPAGSQWRSPSRSQTSASRPAPAPLRVSQAKPAVIWIQRPRGTGASRRAAPAASRQSG